MRIRGRIVRIAVVTETVDTSHPDVLRWKANPRRKIREVDTSRRLSDRPGQAGLRLHPVHPNPWRHETGIDLDLDVGAPGS